MRCRICRDKIPLAVVTASGVAICSNCQAPRTPMCGKPTPVDTDDDADAPFDVLLKAIEDAE